ncbi:hypothetical protein GCM10017673_44840 [Streptosporangium violaceochromogenes]|nr:hypothetical protein GCM10017673_44840 [Streptosporangium violaceochromogenes]
MPPPLMTMDPCQRAILLQRALEEYGIASDVHNGYGLALVSILRGLVVWSDGWNYWWRVGWSAEHRRVVYAWHPTMEPARTARRVALRYAELRRRHSPTEVTSSGVVYELISA